MLRWLVLALLAMLPAACVSADITDSQYTVIFDTISCEGACNLGEATFVVSAPGGRFRDRRSETFEINDEGTYALNFGYRFDGPGVRYSLEVGGRRSTAITQPLTVETPTGLNLGGPQRRAFRIGLEGQQEESRFAVSYFLYRAAP